MIKEEKDFTEEDKRIVVDAFNAYLSNLAFNCDNINDDLIIEKDRYTNGLIYDYKDDIRRLSNKVLRKINRVEFKVKWTNIIKILMKKRFDYLNDISAYLDLSEDIEYIILEKKIKKLCKKEERLTNELANIYDKEAYLVAIYNAYLDYNDEILSYVDSYKKEKESNLNKKKKKRKM